MLEFYPRVPKSIQQNLQFRRSVIKQGDASPAAAEEIWHACERDVLFFLNTFCFVYEPRTKSTLPFITWGYQDKAILSIRDAIRITQKNIAAKEDRLVAKSRDVGASWFCLGEFLHEWLFSPGSSFLLGSRKEEYVDKPDDHKSLFWKLDFLLKYLPAWLKPDYSRMSMHFHNEDNGCTIDGESTNADFGRGDRRTAILLDEFAAVENGKEILAACTAATNCRIFNSTPQGTGNAFYETYAQMKRLYPERILRVHWSQHPHKTAGLYSVSTDGEITILDKQWHDEHPNYPFAHVRPQSEEGVRSEWYDEECSRIPHQQIIAQELDIDFLASDHQFFAPAIIEKLKKEHCRPPWMTGMVTCDPELMEVAGFKHDFDGPLKLWAYPNAYNSFPKDRNYGIGVDVSFGVGATPSVVSVGDKKTGEKVARFSDNRTNPFKLAEIVFALGRWFGGLTGEAFVIWESQGPGRSFQERLIELGYSNLYIRQNEMSVLKKQTDTYGWTPTDDNKKAALSSYKIALETGTFINRDSDAMDETLQFIFTKRSTIEHALAAGNINPAAAKKLHGDLVTADFLCNKALGEVQNVLLQEAATVAPPNSMAGRLAKWTREQKMAGKW